MSLARTLLSGVSESTSIDLSENSYDGPVIMESSFTDAAIESLITDIYTIDKAYMVADVIGEVQVIKEGADPEVLLEAMKKDAFGKLKAAFKNFLAKIKEWFARVKVFFKTLTMNGEKLVKTYGDMIKNKKVTGFKYKGFKYTIDKGDQLVRKVSEDISTEIDSLAGAMGNISELSKKSGEDNITNGKTISDSQASITSNLYPGVTKDVSTTDYQEKIIKAIDSKCWDTASLSDRIDSVYRDGFADKSAKREIKDFSANSKDEMMKFLSSQSKTISDLNTQEKKFEDDVKTAVTVLDKVSKLKEDDGKGGNIDYSLATKISSFMSSALAVRKLACDKKVSVYKEINSSWTSVLKSFAVAKADKAVKESSIYEDFDELIALTEADAVEPELPEETEQGEEMAGEGGKKSSCESASLLESAYNYL